MFIELEVCEKMLNQTTTLKTDWVGDLNLFGYFKKYFALKKKKYFALPKSTWIQNLKYPSKSLK